MKSRKVPSLLLLLALVCGLIAGCGGGGSSSTGAETRQLATAGEGAEKMTMWAFVELHGQFYSDMLKRWNEENPGEQLDIEFTVMPYDDMHNKLTLALQSGQGAPDLCDIEIGKFPGYLQGEVQFADLTSYVDEYRSDIVPTRLEIYSRDGKNYGIPTHVGATVAFYNTEILEGAGVDYTAIKTWDDYKAAGMKVKEAGRIMGCAETNNASILDIMLAEQGADKTDKDGRPTLNTPEALRALTAIKEFHDLGIDQTIPGGHPDTEEGYGALNGGEYACVIRPLWYMSRYTNYMDDLKGKIAIAPCPVFEEGDIMSYGGGGTGTVVYKDCKNIDLAGRWLCYAKLSRTGNEQIWNVLGFDPCNMSLWEDKELTHNPDNKFVQYFKNNPFDVLNEIKDKMGIIKSTSGVPTVNNILCTITLNEVIENGADPAAALKEAQEQAENELGL